MTILYVDNDMRVSFSGTGKLTNEKGEPVTGATIEMTLIDIGTGEGVAGETWPVTFTEDGVGEYSAVLRDTVRIVNGEKYEIRIDAQGSGASASWREIVKAKNRRFL